MTKGATMTGAPQKEYIITERALREFEQHYPDQILDPGGGVVTALGNNIRCRPYTRAEQVLDVATAWLFDQFKQFTNGKYVFGSDWLADWWIERVGYLRTPEGQAELRAEARR